MNSLPRSRRWLHLPSSIAILLLGALAQTGCDEASSQPQNPPEAPGTLPSPVPSVSPSPLPSGAVWNVVEYVKVCPYPDCPPREGFSVDSRGDYTFGSASADGPTSTGTLETSDFTQLSDHVARVMEQDLSGLPTCISLEVLPGASSERVDIRVESGTLFRVYEANTVFSSLCWYGERARAEILLQTLDTLATQYVPQTGSRSQ